MVYIQYVSFSKKKIMLGRQIDGVILNIKHIKNQKQQRSLRQ